MNTFYNVQTDVLVFILLFTRNIYNGGRNKVFGSKLQRNSPDEDRSLPSRNVVNMTINTEENSPNNVDSVSSSITSLYKWLTG